MQAAARNPTLTETTGHSLLFETVFTWLSWMSSWLSGHFFLLLLFILIKMRPYPKAVCWTPPLSLAKFFKMTSSSTMASDIFLSMLVTLKSPHVAFPFPWNSMLLQLPVNSQSPCGHLVGTSKYHGPNISMFFLSPTQLLQVFPISVTSIIIDLVTLPPGLEVA